MSACPKRYREQTLVLNTFYYQLTQTTLKNVELLKHSKINKNAPTCFGLHGNHLQGAKVSTWLKVTRLVNSRCVKDVQGFVSAMAAYCDLYGVCVVHCVRVYSNTVHDTQAVQVTICSHSTDEALHIFHASAVNRTCNF